MKRRVLPLLLINRLLSPINWLKRIRLSLKIILIEMFLLLEETQENFPEQLKLQKVWKTWIQKLTTSKVYSLNYKKRILVIKTLFLPEKAPYTQQSVNIKKEKPVTCHNLWNRLNMHKMLLKMKLVKVEWKHTEKLWMIMLSSPLDLKQTCRLQETSI